MTVVRCDACAGLAVPCDACVRQSLMASASTAEVGRPPRSIDPAILWAHAREARRLQAQARMERVVTFVQIGIGLLLLAPFGLLVADWPSTVQNLPQFSEIPWTLIGVATGIVALGAIGIAALISQDA